MIIGPEELYPEIELGFAIKVPTWDASIVKDTVILKINQTEYSIFTYESKVHFQFCGEYHVLRTKKEKINSVQKKTGFDFYSYYSNELLKNKVVSWPF